MKADLIRKTLQEHGILMSTLVYGPPGGGKTRYAMTICKSKKIKNIYLFSLDKGYHSGLFAEDKSGKRVFTDEELNKVSIFVCEDSQKYPRAYDMISSVLASKKPIWINEEGKTSNVKLDGYEEFPGWFNMTKEDVVIIDPLSQLGDSVHNFNLKRFSFKNLMQYYGEDRIIQADMLAAIQSSKFPVICLTQAHIDEQTTTEGDKVYPVFGSRNFSIQTASYFGNVVYMDVTNTYKKGSTPTYRLNTIARSRANVKVETGNSDSTIVDLIFPEVK